MIEVESGWKIPYQPFDAPPYELGTLLVAMPVIVFFWKKPWQYRCNFPCVPSFPAFFTARIEG